MAVNTRFLALLILVALAGEGCHSGGGSTALMPGLSPQSQQSNGSGSASFSVVVPAAAAPGGASMQSIVVTLTKVNNGAPATKIAPVTLNLTATTPGCTPTPGKTLTCTATIAVPAGSDNFTIATFSRPNGIGTLVSTTQASAQITNGGKTTCTQTKAGAKPAASTSSPT